MTEKEDRIYCFKELEFAVLLAASGVETLYGYSAEYESASDESVILAVHSLLKKGACRMDGQKLVPSGDAAQWTRQLALSHTVVRMVTDRDREKMYLAYVSEHGFVAVEKAMGEFRVQAVPGGGWMKWAEENGLLPDRSLDAGKVPDTSEDGQAAEFAERGPGLNTPLEELLEDDRRFSSFDVISLRLGIVEKRYLIMRGSLYYYLLRCGAEEKAVLAYTVGAGEEMFKSFRSEGGLLE